MIYSHVTSQKSVAKSVPRKERKRRSLRVSHAKTIKGALCGEKSKIDFSRTHPFFCEKTRIFSTKTVKSQFFPQKSWEITKIRGFPAIFGVFPSKKRQRHGKSVAESVWKSVTPRKERNTERAYFRK